VSGGGGNEIPRNSAPKKKRDLLCHLHHHHDAAVTLRDSVGGERVGGKEKRFQKKIDGLTTLPDEDPTRNFSLRQKKGGGKRETKKKKETKRTLTTLPPPLRGPDKKLAVFEKKREIPERKIRYRVQIHKTEGP